MKYKYALLMLLFINTHSHAAGFKSCIAEQAIIKFMSGFTKCTITLTTNYLIPISETGEDYSKFVPRLIGTDLKVSVNLQMCEINEEYLFWLRKGEKNYQIISYTSVNQPE